MMNEMFQARNIHGWIVSMMVVCVLMVNGCFPQSVPLAMLPMEEPEAAAFNLKGIDQYHVGEWKSALDFFESALRVNPLLVEAHFNAALALHQ